MGRIFQNLPSFTRLQRISLKIPFSSLRNSSDNSMGSGEPWSGATSQLICVILGKTFWAHLRLSFHICKMSSYYVVSVPIGCRENKMRLLTKNYLAAFPPYKKALKMSDVTLRCITTVIIHLPKLILASRVPQVVSRAELAR